MQDYSDAQPLKKRVDAYTDEEIADALKKCRGLQYLAGEYLGCTDSRISQRIKESDYLKHVVFQCRELRKDKAEYVLSKLAEKDENTTALLFYLKTQAKERGYIENSPPEPAPDQFKKQDEWMAEMTRWRNDRDKEREANNG